MPFRTDTISLNFRGSRLRLTPVKFSGLSKALTPMHTRMMPMAPMPMLTQQAADRNAWLYCPPNMGSSTMFSTIIMVMGTM